MIVWVEWEQWRIGRCIRDRHSEAWLGGHPRTAQVAFIPSEILREVSISMVYNSAQGGDLGWQNVAGCHSHTQSSTRSTQNKRPLVIEMPTIRPLDNIGSLWLSGTSQRKSCIMSLVLCKTFSFALCSGRQLLQKKLSSNQKDYLYLQTAQLMKRSTHILLHKGCQAL
jgi:hypothetical protein